MTATQGPFGLRFFVVPGLVSAAGQAGRQWRRSPQGF